MKDRTSEAKEPGPLTAGCSDAEAARRELAPLAARIAKGRAKYPNGCTVLSLLDELALLKELEWSGSARVDYDTHYDCCPSCGGLEPERARDSIFTAGEPIGHLEGCKLAALIQGSTSAKPEGT